MVVKYFKESEIIGLDLELVEKLDAARGLCGFPFHITSGYRTPEENSKLEDSKPDSAHVKGLAVDLQRPTGDFEAKKMVWALGRVQFRRLEICDKHFHVDLDPDKPQDYVWAGVSK